MRKTLFYIVAVLMLITALTACTENEHINGQPDPPPASSPPPPDNANNPPNQPDGPPDYLDPPPYSATIEYGMPDIIKNNNGPLYAYIRFPQAGDSTDTIIADWAYGVYESARAEFGEVLRADDTATGEVNVNFDSWLVDDRFTGILERGSFTHSHMAHPRDITKTINIDLLTGKLLDNSEILDPSQNEKVLALLRDRILTMYPETHSLLDELDESWLSELAISGEGIMVVLERYAYLPGILGTVTVTIPYDDLGSALVLGTTQAPTQPPASPDPPATSDPSPSPSPASPTSPSPSPASPSPAPSPEPSPLPPIPIVPPQTGDIDPSRPMVALTFDDGPSGYTTKILDLLEQYGARATFFTVGNLVNAYSSTVARAVSLGCEVAGHSWEHKNLVNLSEDDIRRQLVDASDAVEEVTGVRAPFFRPPYGNVNDRLRSVSGELGLAMINWSVDPMDWDTRDAAKVYDAIMHDARNGSIILSHDIYGSTAEAMSRVIPALIAEGYQLVTVSELLYHKYGTLEPGRVYYNG